MFEKAIFSGLLTVAASAILGCSSTPTPTDDGGVKEAGVDAPTDGTTSALGTLTGTLKYTGSRVGVTAYVTGWNTPNGIGAGPPNIASVVKGPLTFPTTYTITGVVPSDYYVGGYISVGTDHQFGPQSGDAVFPTPLVVNGVPQSAKVTVSAGKTATLDITFEDYDVDGGAPDGGPSDGGADASDAALD